MQAASVTPISAVAPEGEKRVVGIDRERFLETIEAKLSLNAILVELALELSGSPKSIDLEQFCEDWSLKPLAVEKAIAELRSKGRLRPQARIETLVAG